MWNARVTWNVDLDLINYLDLLDITELNCTYKWIEITSSQFHC